MISLRAGGHCRCWWLITHILIAAIVLAASGLAADSPPVLSRDGQGGLRKDGKPFRAIGVNYFSCFYRTLLDGAVTS